MLDDRGSKPVDGNQIYFPCPPSFLSKILEAHSLQIKRVKSYDELQRGSKYITPFTHL